jgi:serine phosphatase RsbU (regulator of sigma subunit)
MSRILLLIAHSENRRLLSDWLGALYDVAAPEVAAPEQTPALATAFDLCIVDGPILHRLEPWARAVKSAQHPAFLPFLLLTHRHDVGLAKGQIWRTVDELIAAPVEKIELHARVEMLLRARRLSLDNAILLRQVEAELARARDVQCQLLPERPVPVDGFELAARCVPSLEVGGDFYDWQELAPGTVALTLGDVMGKGMAAALLMATMRATVRAVTHANPQPSAALDIVRLALAPDLERTGSFVTLFHSRLDAPLRRLAYVDAGHGHGFVLRRGGVEPIQRGGRPIGVPSGGHDYEEKTLVFEPGEALVIYSDGLIAPGEDIPSSRDDLAARLAGASDATDMVERLVNSRIGAQPPPADDLTVLVLRCVGR